MKELAESMKIWKTDIVFGDSETLHNHHYVYPLNDLKPHTLLSFYCRCSPKVEQDSDGVWIVHNAFDGREFADAEDAGYPLLASKPVDVWSPLDGH